MSQVVYFPGEVSQISTPNSFIARSIYTIGSDAYRSITTTRPPSAPITGRKVQAEQHINFNSTNGARFPIAVSTPVQKPKRSVPLADKKLLDISNRPPQSRGQSNNESNKKSFSSKTPEGRRMFITEKKPKTPVVNKSSNIKTHKHKKEKKNDNHTLDPAKLVSKAGCINNGKNVDRISTFEMLRQLADAPEISDAPDKPRVAFDERSDPRINSIVQQTLKEHRQNKLNRIKEEQEAKEENEKRKREMQDMQNQIRQENLMRFKQENFTPKLAWGADQRKLFRDQSADQEIQEIRQRRRQERERAKSAGKARIGLEIFSQLKADFNEQLRSSSTVPHEAPAVPKKEHKKKHKKPDPSILHYMKLQKLQRKIKQEAEAIEYKTEETKRLSKLKQLEIRSKSKLSKYRKHKKRPKSKPNVKPKVKPNVKPKVKPRLLKVPEEIWIEDSYLPDSEDHEVMGIMHQLNESITDPYNRQGRESRVFGHFAPQYLYDEVGNSTQIVNKIVEKRNYEDISLPPASVTMPILESKERRNLFNLEIPSQNSSIPRSNDEQKSFDRYEEDISLEEEEDFENPYNTDISRKKQEIRKKLSELRNRMDRFKESVSEERSSVSERHIDLPERVKPKPNLDKVKKGVYILHNFARWKWIEDVFENILYLDTISRTPEDYQDFFDEDEEVQHILNVKNFWDIPHKEDLQIQTPDNEDHEEDSAVNEELELETDQDELIEEDKEADFSVEKDEHPFKAIIPGQRLSTVEIEARLNAEMKNLEAKQHRVENLLMLQQQLQEVHQQALQQLREKDLNDMKKLSQQMGRDNELIDIFKTILERRYAELSQMFQENIEAVKTVLDQEGSLSLVSTPEQRSEIHRKLDEDMRYMINNYQKNYIDSQEEEVERLFAGELGTQVCAEIEQKVEKEMKREIPRPLNSKGSLSIEFRNISPLKEQKTEESSETQPISARISRGTIDDNFKQFDERGYFIYDSRESSGKDHQIINYEEIRKKYEDNMELNSIQSDQSINHIDHGFHSEDFDKDIDIDKYLLEISSREITEITNRFSTGELNTILNTESLPKAFHTTAINISEYSEISKPIVSPEFLIESESEAYSDLSSSLKTIPKAPVFIPYLNLSSKQFPHDSPESNDERSISSQPSDLKHKGPTSSPRSEISINDIQVYNPSYEDSPFSLQDSESSSLVTSQRSMKSPSIFTTEVISPIAADSPVSLKMSELFMFPSSPAKGRKNIFIKESAEYSPGSKAILVDVGQSPNSSISQVIRDDSLVLDSLQPETEDVIPERPAAPLSNREESERSKRSTSSIEDIRADEESDIEWLEELRTPRSIDANFMNEIADEMLKRLLSENLVPVASRSLPDLPPLNLQELPPRPIEGLTTTTEPRINTDHTAIKKYVEEIFMACNQRRNEFIQNLQKPLSTHPLEILARMQENEIGVPNIHEYQQPSSILGVDLYLQLERLREEESSNRDELSPGTLQLVSEAEHIHNKMIFDGVNEALQKYRPYGSKGLPLPWSAGAREVSNKTINVDKAVKEVIQEVEKWSLVQAGKVPTGDMMLSSGMLDEEHLRQIREERLANMLADEVIERDAEWVDYEFEETQVKLDLADMVLEHLITETMEVLDSI